MKKLNIVYAYMREPRFEVELPDREAQVVWTRSEEADADVVVYSSGYSYSAKQAVNPDAFRILYTYEPLVVYPRQFLKNFWKPFDVVLTWSEAVVEQYGKFVRFPSLYYGFPFGAAHGIADSLDVSSDWKNKKKAIVQVAGNKRSFVRSELYSHRREIARWFGANGTLDLDTYGVPAMPVPGYKGRAADKLETLSRYRFALCIENDGHPLWSRGYVTEKIFDCFYASTVPVYLGAADIEQHVPSECFIDLRKFESLDELDRFLSTMSDETYFQYLENIDRFLEAYDAPSKHSCLNLYETALNLAAKPPPATGDPFGFWQKASLSEKAGCVLMMTALPVYKALKGTRYAGT
jgi:hypothetical protein